MLYLLCRYVYTIVIYFAMPLCVKNQWRDFIHKAQIGHKTPKPENDLVANRPQLKCSARRAGSRNLIGHRWYPIRD